mgnify:CR=1 FL=1
MKAKGSLSARPRFHIIFQTELITNATDCKGIKDRLSKFFPYVDSNALDTARFFFGTEHPQVEFHEGTITLNDFLASQDDDSWSDDLDSIKEGNRNSTLSHIAGKLVVRHGDTDEAKALFLSEAGKCTPPLPDDELEHIWSNTKKFFQKVSSQEDYISPEIYNFHTELSPNDYSDVGQAEVLSRKYKNELIFTPALSFLWYNGMYWEASEEKAQAVAQLLTGRQLEDADMALEKALTMMDSINSLSYDSVIELYLSIKPEYRKNGTWLMNDTTALALRKLKDVNGNYLWRTSDDTILGKKVEISPYMPDIAAGASPITFGDLSYVWFLERQPLSLKVLSELYANENATGYAAFERIDCKLIRPKAVALLSIAE